jgi:Pyridine nucleotide-disulphide oxidoreductase
VTSTGALELKEVPEELVVVGGGVIGLEMGSVWSRLGAHVTVVEFTPTIVPSLDGDIRKAFQRTLAKQGINFLLGRKVLGADEGECGRLRLRYEGVKDGKAGEVDTDIVLVATGRRAITGACRCAAAVVGVGTELWAVATVSGCLSPDRVSLLLRVATAMLAALALTSRVCLQTALTWRSSAWSSMSAAASRSTRTSAPMCPTSTPSATSSPARCLRTRRRRTASRPWRSSRGERAT